MAQITVHAPRPHVADDLADGVAIALALDEYDPDGLPDDGTGGEEPHEGLRSLLPVSAAVLLLLGLLIAGGVWLRQVLDFGVWFLSAT